MGEVDPRKEYSGPRMTMADHPAAGAAERIERIRSGRGYVLAFHELWAQWEPELLDRYNAFYEFLAFDPKEMSAARRELIWIAALTAAREVRGKLHVNRANDAGLSPRIMASAVRIACCADLYEALRFSAEAWGIPEVDSFPEDGYDDAFAALAEGIDKVTAHLAASSAMAVRRNEAGCRLHLSVALEAGATPREAVEAVSIAFMPGGAPALMLGTEVLLSVLNRGSRDQPV